MDKTICELFAGVGGFRLGFDRLESGWETTWFSQWEPGAKTQWAHDCYVQHFGECPDLKGEIHTGEDISLMIKENIPDHSLLVGGFPCQDYSVAHTLKSSKGIEGKKGVLWWQIREVLIAKKAPFCIFENVDRLLKSPAKQRGRDFGIILACLAELGYSAEWRVVNAAQYGAAQRRRRTFIFAYRNDTNYGKRQLASSLENIIDSSGFMIKAFPISECEQGSYTTLSTDLVDISEKFSFAFENAGAMRNYKVVTKKVIEEEEKPIILGDILQRNVDDRFYISPEKMPKWTYLKGSKKIPRTASNGHEYTFSEGPVAFPDPWDRPGRTMLTSESTLNRSTHVVSDPGTGRLRILTPIEAERLQGFDDDWTCSGMPERMRYFCMGNALVVPMITRMGKVLDSIIEQEQNSQVFSETPNLAIENKSNKIVYKWTSGSFVIRDKELLYKCSKLYSEHYGTWGNQGCNPNMPVKLSPEKLVSWLDKDGTFLYYAMYEDEIVGYAIAFSKNETFDKEEKDTEPITWVTQLVVHTDYRHQGIAKSLLFSIWTFSDHYAWGIVSANPYAIRALEKATRRRAIPVRIKRSSQKLKAIGKKYVPFIEDSTEFDINDKKSLVNTKFFVNHGDTIEKILNITSDENPWVLGDLKEGWEWIAFTFKDQEPISLTKDEIEKMISTSDAVVHNAYSRMKLDEKKQAWMKKTKAEIDYIDKIVDLKTITHAYDLGCGIGRHSLELARRGVNVTAIDYVEENTMKLTAELQKEEIKNVTAIQADCRIYTSDKKASLVLCLYDVIGTFSTNEENMKIIKTAFDLLGKGGYAVISVMNYESTLANAINIFRFSKNPDRLLSLPASETMQSTGNVFDPKYYLVDEETREVYRKEKFNKSIELPAELIVKDKRFSKDEIIALCTSVGFSIVEAKYTNASGWENEYSAVDPSAKEILLICRKES